MILVHPSAQRSLSFGLQMPFSTYCDCCERKCEVGGINGNFCQPMFISRKIGMVSSHVNPDNFIGDWIILLIKEKNLENESFSWLQMSRSNGIFPSVSLTCLPLAHYLSFIEDLRIVRKTCFVSSEL
jgi:hypothetical protein